MLVKREFRTDSGGPGKYRGGLGHWLVVRGVEEGKQVRLSPFFDRTQYPARGYQGGQPGAAGVYSLDDGRRPNPKATVYVDGGVDIVMGLPGGGGFYDPLERDPEAVRADVRDELVSPERALEDYGVVLDAAFNVDTDATERTRAARRGGQTE